MMYRNRSHIMNPPLSPSNGNRSHDSLCLTWLRHGNIQGLAKDTGCQLNFTAGGACHYPSQLTAYPPPQEGLHDTVHTYTHMILPHHLVSFLYGAVLRNTMNLLLLLIYFIARLKFLPNVCFYILVTRS